MAARQREGLRIDRARSEALVFRTDTNEAHALNETAAIVFDLCNGSTSKPEMAAEIHRRTGLPADAEIVDLALNELVDAGLVVLEGAGAQPAMTRRSLIRRLMLPAAAAAMLPIVETILVPPAYAQGPMPPMSPAAVPLGPSPFGTPSPAPPAFVGPPPAGGPSPAAPFGVPSPAAPPPFGSPPPIGVPSPAGPPHA